VHGVARIRFAAQGAQTRLASLYQQAPLRVLFPHAPRSEPLPAVLVMTSGGLVGGDRLEVEVEAGAESRALATTQAAEKVYRSTGADAHLDVDLRADDGAWLEWLPQETILFEAARLHRRTTVRLGENARAMAGEILVFGRSAHGEQLRTGALRDAWQVHRGDRLIWADRLRLDGDVAARLAAPFGFAGARASATLVYVGGDAALWRDGLRELVGTGDAGQHAGVTCLPDLLLVRWLDRDAARLRAAFARVWSSLRNRAAGLPARMPATWNC